MRSEVMKLNSFTPVARAYTEKVSPHRHSQFLALVHELPLKGDERVLDIGCGPGVLSLELASHLNRGGQLTGVDLSARMIRLANKNARDGGFENVEFVKGDALGLDFDDHQFDVIVSSNAFPWVADRQLFLRETYRVLKPDGRFGLVALSTKCYREFSEAFRMVAEANRSVFPNGSAFELSGARLHTLPGLARKVSDAGFDIRKRFVFSIEEPITADDYILRVNAIVNEKYLEHFTKEIDRRRARKLIYDQLAKRNGTLNVTESSVFVIAGK